MPEGKYVYFAPDGKHFETFEKCAEYEESLNLTSYLRSKCPGVTPLHIPAIAKAILEKYHLTERDDYEQFPSLKMAGEILPKEGEISPYSGDGTEASPNGTL